VHAVKDFASWRAPFCEFLPIATPSKVRCIQEINMQQQQHKGQLEMTFQKGKQKRASVMVRVPL